MHLVDTRGKFLGRINFIDSCAAFFVLFSAAMLVHFAWHNIGRHSELTLEEIRPEVFIPGVHSQVSVYGNGFSESIRVEVDGQVQAGISWINEAQIDIKLPEDIGSGSHQIMLRTPKGRMVTRSDLFKVRWVPVVHAIALEEAKTNFATYRIFGKYFHPGCEVAVGGKPVIRKESLGPQELRVTVPDVSPEFSWAELKISNPDGGVLELRGEELLQKEDSGRRRFSPEPRILSFLPNCINVQNGYGVAIAGYDLTDRYTVKIGGKPLENMEWVYPNMAVGFLPPYSLPAGEHPVELIDPEGKEVVAEKKMAAVLSDMVEVELRIYGLTRENFQKQFPKGNRTLPILRIYDRGRKMDEVEIRVHLPVEIQEMGINQYYYKSQRVHPGLTIPLSLSRNRVLPAEIISLPKLVRKSNLRKNP